MNNKQTQLARFGESITAPAAATATIRQPLFIYESKVNIGKTNGGGQRKQGREGENEGRNPEKRETNFRQQTQERSWSRLLYCRFLI